MAVTEVQTCYSCGAKHHSLGGLCYKCSEELRKITGGGMKYGGTK